MIFLFCLLFLTKKILEPKVEYIDYYNQKLELYNSIIITNKFDSSHEVCYSGITKIIRDGKEEILIDFPHTKDLYIKGCAIDIIYIDKETIEFPICYSGGGGSGECSLVNMQYNIKTNKWLFLGTKDYYVGEDEIPLYYKIVTPYFALKSLLNYKKDNGNTDYGYLKGVLFGKTFTEVMQEKHFDDFFFRFINYFNDNYGIENFDSLNEIYKSNILLLSLEDKEKILNTVYYYTDRQIDYWLTIQTFDKELMSYYDIELSSINKKYLAKLKYVENLRINRLNDNKGPKYQKDIPFDNEVKKIFEKVLKIEKENKKKDRYWY